MNVEVTEKERITKIKEEVIKLKGELGVIRTTEEIFEGGVLKAKQTTTKYLETKRVENGEIQLFDKKIRELHRTQNISHIAESSKEYDLFRNCWEPDFDKIVELKDNWEEKYEFLINKIFYSGQLFDLEENELPRAMTFDYMKGSVSNKNFNLGKLITFLRTLEQVELLGEKKIEEIPWYNTSKGENEHISFKIIPTISDWEQIKMTEIKYGACTESDKLLEKFLEFYGINEFRKEKDE